MGELPFQSAIMRLTDSAGTTIASNLPVQLDIFNYPWNQEVQGMIPTDWFDLYSVNWVTPVPARSNYFVDQATGTKYSVFSVIAVYVDHLECRITRYSGVTP